MENPSTPYDMLKKALEGHGGGNAKPHKLMLCKTIETTSKRFCKLFPSVIRIRHPSVLLILPSNR